MEARHVAIYASMSSHARTLNAREASKTGINNCGVKRVKRVYFSITSMLHGARDAEGAESAADISR
jgi:hypothetical protein